MRVNIKFPALVEVDNMVEVYMSENSAFSASTRHMHARFKYFMTKDS